MKFTITTNADVVAKQMAHFEKHLQTATINALKRIGDDGVRMAKTLAPSYTGTLKSNISRTPIIITKEHLGVSIFSGVAKKFPYHFWVNEEPNYKSIRLWGGKKRTYASTEKTGTPRYFKLTATYLRARYKKIMIKEVSGAMKNSFRKT